MADTYEKYREKLRELADPKYEIFIKSLIPGVEDALGVRSPDMKKLAKELYKDNWREYFELNQDKYLEETMLQGSVIGLMKEDVEYVLGEVRKYIPKITNWALCDGFCGGLKITKNHKDRMWEFIKDYVNSVKAYEIRFAVVMMLAYYIEDEHIEQMLVLLENIKHEDYYVKMAVAWAVSMCYVSYTGLTLEYLKECKLDDFTYNKSLSKICESLKPSAEEKALIKTMKRRALKRALVTSE
ncbi:MAG: DNA alkylation repair protein [Clostridia bacterium]|nr:DNA alkylation repair protein [Clostridia bacterium]